MGINRDALYSIGKGFYREPEESPSFSKVKIRFRTLKEDVDCVTLIFQEENSHLFMTLSSCDHYFDYYEAEIEIQDIPLYYYFQIQKGEERVFYNRLGVTEDLNLQYAFSIFPDFFVPSWVKGAVMYQIFVDRFYNSSGKNNVEDREYIYLGRPVEAVSAWNTKIEPFDVHRFYGGDLEGVWEKLDYLEYLGVEVLYFNPLFVSPSNHKYDTQDYDHIDPHLGVIVKDGGELLKEGDLENRNASRYSIRSTDKENLEASDALFWDFVQACHDRGMRVIIDGVFNHCGSFHRYMNASFFYKTGEGNPYPLGAFESYDSPYREYFHFLKKEEKDWPENENYEKWWGNDTLPKLNYENAHSLEEEILSVAKKWVSPPYNCDGWRLDVAADLGHSEEYNHYFWQAFRKVVKEANSEAVILAEHYGNPSSWLRGKEWDSIMNYDAFMEPVSWFLTGMEKHSDRAMPECFGNGNMFFDTMRYKMANMPENTIDAAMNQLSNHDHSRFLTRTNRRVGRIKKEIDDAALGVDTALFRLGAMILLTWPGAPTLFYGDEVGVPGWTEPDCRRPYPWGEEDMELLDYHRYLLSHRKNLSALRNGALMLLQAGQNYAVYARSSEKQVAVIVIYTGESDCTLPIPLWRAGITDKMLIRRILKTDYRGYNAGQTRRFARNGYIDCRMWAKTGKLYLIDLEEVNEIPHATRAILVKN